MLNSSSEPDLAVLSQLARFEKLLLAGVASVSGAILAIWYLPPLAAFAPSGWSKMTALTAICMLFLAGSLALSRQRRSAMARYAGKSGGFAVFALGLLVLFAYATGFTLAVAHFLPTDPAASNLGRPSPQTAAFLALAGLTVAFIAVSGTRLSIWVDIGALALFAVTLFLLGGYVFPMYQLVGINPSNLTAPHSLACMILLTFVIAGRRAVEGRLLAVLVTRGMGGRAARMLLPGIVALPFLWLTLIAYASQPGWMPAAYARAVAAPVLALVAFGIVAWLALRTNALERELQLQSSTDELTDVFNRRGFYAVADYALLNAARMGAGVMLFFFDLDGLKQINDRLGHEAGSASIRRFAGTLVTTFRKTDIVARLGGDEFVVLAATTQESAEELLKRLGKNVNLSNALDSAASEVAYSAGYVEVANPAATTINDLVAQADALMYEQKQRKKRESAPGAPKIATDQAAA